MKIQTLASVPREIGFRLHWRCQVEALAPLNLMPREYGGCFWNEQLEQGIEEAIENGFDYVLTLDYDVIFTRKHVEAMIDLATRHPQADVILPWMVKRESRERLFGVRQADGIFRRRFDEAEFNQELMPIDTGHFGLTMIRLDALRSLPRPMFWAQPDPGGHWGADCVQSDIYFFNQCRKFGLGLFLATQVRVGHLQQVITWPTADFEIQHQHVEAFQQWGPPEDTL